jgi:BirA family biotin operon repressor/biotin-[acetyl-CoA-carboxylase] ligase
VIGRKIIYKDSLNSTNNYVANKVLSGGIEHGSVVLAGIQSAGKGQREAKWDSEPNKNLSLSVFLEYVNLSLNHLVQINQFVSLACSDFLKDFDRNFQIKWPNDLIIGNKKIGGILIESQLEKSRIKSSIIGIGINVNQEIFGNYNATSLKNHLNKDYSVQDCMFLLIEKLNHRFEQFTQFKYLELKKNYLENLWLFEKTSFYKITKNECVFEGKIKDIDENGALIIENISSNKILTFQHKEIVFLERNNF